ncbi:MAG: hypothetical protein GY697_23265, partial [Desulfobacterales bacterium]|nr:hypothetical protein [Desulfobacterales bacterium]
MSVTAEDPQGATISDSFSYTVGNPAPIAADDDLAGNEDTVASGDVFADNGNGVDSDPDGDTFTVSEVNGVPGDVGQPIAGDNGGTFVINNDGSLGFDPGSDFDGLVVGTSLATSVTYTIDDGEGGTDSATITYTVTNENDGPEVIVGSELADTGGNDAETIADIDVTGTFTDADTADVLSYSATGLPTGLTIDPLTGIISGTIDPSASQGGPGS